MRYHPALGFLVTQRENRIGRPANLERSGLLQVLALEKQVHASQGVKGCARQHRRPVNPWPDALVCLHNGFPHNRGGPEFRVQIGRHDRWVIAYFRLRITAKRCLRPCPSLAIVRVLGILLSIHAPAHVPYSCSEGIPCRLRAILPCLGRFLRGVRRFHCRPILIDEFDSVSRSRPRCRLRSTLPKILAVLPLLFGHTPLDPYTVSGRLATRRATEGTPAPALPRNQNGNLRSQTA